MATNLLVSLSIDQLRRALSLKEQIATLEVQLSQMVGVPSPAPAAPAVKRSGTGKRSAAARAKMAAAQKARWAKVKAQTVAAPAKVVRRRLSATTRAKMAAGAKARWAQRKAAGGKQ
jgi:hypothetical protein